MKYLKIFVSYLFSLVLLGCGGGGGGPNGGNAQNNSPPIAAGTVSLIAQITDTNLSLAGLTLSPDGSTIFVAASSASTNGYLYKLNVSTGHQLAQYQLVINDGFTYSPYWVVTDGTSVFSSWGRSGSASQTKLLTLDMGLNVIGNAQPSVDAPSINGLALSSSTLYGVKIAILNTPNTPNTPNTGTIASYASPLWTDFSSSSACYGTGYARGFAISSAGYSYVVDDTGLQVCQLSTMQRVGSSSSVPSNPRGIVVQSVANSSIDTAYIVSYDGSIKKYAIDHSTSNATITDQGLVPVTWNSQVTGFCNPYGIAADAQYLYVANSDGCVLINNKNTIIKIKL